MISRTPQTRLHCQYDQKNETSVTTHQRHGSKKLSWQLAAYLEVAKESEPFDPSLFDGADEPEEITP